MPVLPRPSITLVALAITIAACNRGDRNAASAQAVGDTIGAARRASVIPVPASAYRTIALAASGRVTGTVSFSGTPPGDTLIVVPPDGNGCGTALQIQRLVRHADRVSGVVVWISDIRAGAPLAPLRRFELTNNDCAWSPVIQTVATGGTLNVLNYDPLVERATAVDVATGDTVATAPFTDNGQIVPYDRLLKQPRLIEFSVESRPMSRAWVAVFDTPYNTVTDANGNFTIGDVPPGRHTVRAWHPLLGVTETTIDVPANGVATGALHFTPKPG